LYKYLKSEILEQFAAGKTVSEVSRAFPEVPQRTLYDWAKQQEQALSPLTRISDIEARTVDIQGFADSANNSADSADSASLKVVPFRGERSPTTTTPPVLKLVPIVP